MPEVEKNLDRQFTERLDLDRNKTVAMKTIRSITLMLNNLNEAQ